MAKFTLTPNLTARAHQIYQDGSLIGAFDHAYLVRYAEAHLGTGMEMAKAPGQAFAELKAQATKLIAHEKAAGRELRFDQAILRIAQNPENEALCKQWRRDQGFPEKEPDEDEGQDE
jgi:hypothetical protein